MAVGQLGWTARWGLEGAASVTAGVGQAEGTGAGPTHQRMAAEIWAVADKLRGHYMRHEYGEVILPLTVLRRLDAVMAPTRQVVWDKDEELTAKGMQNKERLLLIAAKLPVFNTSKFDFAKLISENDNKFVARNLRVYISQFPENVRKIIERFDLDNHITRMADSEILYEVIGQFAQLKGLERLGTHDMGYVFEHLIRKFYEDANATAGEHFTPREVIHLMVNLLIAPDADTISGDGQVINILDPACGTGGMLTTAEDRIKAINPSARVYLWGQEMNPQSWATCGSEMLLREQPGSIAFGNSFTGDGYRGKTYDYMLANPPFGVEWKTSKKEIARESQRPRLLSMPESSVVSRTENMWSSFWPDFNASRIALASA
jgi:type I restriction enzyme M protein